MEDEDVDPVPVAAGLDRRRAGVARGRADDGDPLAALGQHMVVEPAQELQRHILEGQRRPVEQLQQPGPGIDLLQGRHRLMAETGIGFLTSRAKSASPIRPPRKGCMTRAARSG